MALFNIIIAILIALAVLGGLFALIVWLAGMTAALATYFVALCVIMVLFILVQKPKGGGLSGAFGGAGGGQAAVFGAKTGDLLTVITVVCFVLFLGLGMGLVYSTRSDVAAGPVQTPAAQPEPGAGETGSTPTDPTGTDSTGSSSSQPPTGADSPAADQTAPPAPSGEETSDGDNGPDPGATEPNP